MDLDKLPNERLVKNFFIECEGMGRIPYSAYGRERDRYERMYKNAKMMETEILKRMVPREILQES